MSRRVACTLYDVARAAGVSTATVSRVVHGKDRVRPSTRQRVLEVVEALGFVPDSAAQSLAWQRKEVIGLVSVAPRGPETDVEREGGVFIEEVLRGVQMALRPVGWSVLISVLPDADRSDAYRQLLKLSAKVDGMLIAEGIVSSEELARLAARIPIVLAAGSFDELHADVVDADNWSGTTALARHLLEQHGKKRLFYISGPSEAPDAQERRRAFEEAVARHPGAVMTGCFEGRFAAISGQLAVRELLTAPGREQPDAIVCGNDQMAIGTMRELQSGSGGARRVLRVLNLLIRRFPRGHPALFRPVRDLRRVTVGCPGASRQSGSRSSPWLPVWLPFTSSAWHRGALVLVVTVVTAHTVQGMARVQSGQAPAWPLVSGRSVRRGSGVKHDFACTYTRHFHLCSLSCDHSHA